MGKERSVSPVKDGPGTKQVQRPQICTCACECGDGYMRRGGKSKIPGNGGFQTKRAPRLGSGEASRLH